MDGKCNILHNFIRLKRSLIALVGIVFLLSLVSCSNVTQKNIHCSKLIDRLSSDERKELGAFFHNLFAVEDFGYTLFGDKPMSLCFPNTYPPCFSTRRPYRFILYLEGTVPLAKGLAAWDKLRGISTRNDYSLIIYEEQKYPAFAILINKNALLDVLNKNIDVVKKNYGPLATADSLLKDLEEKKISPDELFNHPLLLGIMLGYGRHSSELFDRRWYLSSDEINPPFLQNHKSFNQRFASANEELNYITERLQTESKTPEWYTNTFPLFLRVGTVAFAFDPDDPEAQSLIRKYKDLHAQLTDIFDQPDWLEIVLDRLLGKDSCP